MKKIIYVLIFTFLFATLAYPSTISQIVEKQGDAIILIAVAGTKGTGLGSGFVVTPTGVIITNHHVVKGAKDIIVKFKNGDIYDKVFLIDEDVRRDIAVIKIQGSNLNTVKLGNSNSIKIGEQIVAIGNPEGLENTVSDGIVSAIRDTEAGYKLIQISTPISQGSSGGAVFNMNGEVIGISCAGMKEGQNLNFAIPINYAIPLISEETKQLISKSSLRKVAFGETIEGVEVELPKDILLVADFNSGKGENNIGGKFGCWSKNPSPPLACIDEFNVKNRIENKSDKQKGYALKLTYNVDSSNQAYGGFWMFLENLNASKYEELCFYAKGDGNIGFTEVFKLEIVSVKGKRKVGYYIVEGIENKWKRFEIPLKDFAGLELKDFSRLKEMIIVFTDATVTNKEGVIYIDNIYFK